MSGREDRKCCSELDRKGLLTEEAEGRTLVRSQDDNSSGTCHCPTEEQRRTAEQHAPRATRVLPQRLRLRRSVTKGTHQPRGPNQHCVPCTDLRRDPQSVLPNQRRRPHQAACWQRTSPGPPRPAEAEVPMSLKLGSHSLPCASS